jgi:hypothetical protein
MQITYTFNGYELRRQRCIQISQLPRSSRYAIPQDSLYDPVRTFFQKYGPTGGFSFRLLALLQATAIKKLALPTTNIRRFRERSLLITGGLYLALNLRHPDLEIREQLGDFAAGFSHEFGVGCTALLASPLFNVPPDALNPIRVDPRKKALDFAALRPDGRGLLLMEAKGVTSKQSRSTARQSIYGKKQDSGNTAVLVDGRTLTSTQVTKIGVIVQAACKRSNPALPPSTRGLIEIIDPELDQDPIKVTDTDIIAGKYWHFAGIALLAGLNNVAEEFAQRAIALTAGRQRAIQLQHYDLKPDREFRVEGHSLVGVQWQPSDVPQGSQDVWFYQAADWEYLSKILANEDFPHTVPYSPDSFSDRDDLVENMFSDGSYFGVGLHSQTGLQKLQ